MTTELQAPILPAIPTGDPAPDYSPLRDLIRERLQTGGADPNRVALALADELSDDLRDLAAAKGLRDLAQEVVRDTRRPRANGNGSAKWAAVAEAAVVHRDVFEDRIWTGDGWRFLGDCSKDDLLAAAAWKRAHAQGYIDRAEREERLAKRVRRGAVVRDLAREKVEEIWNA